MVASPAPAIKRLFNAAQGENTLIWRSPRARNACAPINYPTALHTQATIGGEPPERFLCETTHHFLTWPGICKPQFSRALPTPTHSVRPRSRCGSHGCKFHDARIFISSWARRWIHHLHKNRLLRKCSQWLATAELAHGAEPLIPGMRWHRQPGNTHAL